MIKNKKKTVCDLSLTIVFIVIAIACYAYWLVEIKNLNINLAGGAASLCILLLFVLLVLKLIPLLTKFIFFSRAPKHTEPEADQADSSSPVGEGSDDELNGSEDDPKFSFEDALECPAESGEINDISSADVKADENNDSLPDNPEADSNKDALFTSADSAINIEPLSLNSQDDRRSRLNAWGKVALFVVLTRVALFVLAYVFGKLSGRGGDFLSMLDPIWLHSGIDAPSYLGIAENFYVTSGDPMYHIVFFPYYALLVKLFAAVFSDYFLSAMLVSNLCAVGVGIAGYELMRVDFDKSTALRFVKYIFILPAAFFYSTPMTESTFVLLVLLTLLFARKRKFVFCALFGALAAFTRSPGMLLVIPVGLEAVRALIDTYHDERDRFAPRLLGYVASTLAIFLGFLGYIYINYAVWGNPLQFTVFQKEHWGQSMSFFFNTAEYQMNYAIGALNPILNGDFGDWKRFFALFLPNIIYMFSSLIIVTFGLKKLRPSYCAYFCAYFVFVCGATWLLSAPRYLMASVVLPMAIAVMTKKRWADLTWTVVLSILFLAYLFLYCSGSPIY